MSAGGLENHIDNLGLALLASPYVAKMVSEGAKGVRSLKPIRAAADEYEERFEATPAAEVAGLALVSPTVTKRLSSLVTKAASLGERVALSKLGL
jgi:hypothetical protein